MPEDLLALYSTFQGGTARVLGQLENLGNEEKQLRVLQVGEEFLALELLGQAREQETASSVHIFVQGLPLLLHVLLTRCHEFLALSRNVDGRPLALGAVYRIDIIIKGVLEPAADLRDHLFPCQLRPLP